MGWFGAVIPAFCFGIPALKQAAITHRGLPNYHLFSAVAGILLCAGPILYVIVSADCTGTEDNRKATILKSVTCVVTGCCFSSWGFCAAQGLAPPGFFIVFGVIGVVML